MAKFASSWQDPQAARLGLLIQLLDRISRVRFRKDAESLVAWKSARNVPWPTTAKEPAPPSGPGPSTGNGTGTGIVVSPTQGFSQ